MRGVFRAEVVAKLAERTQLKQLSKDCFGKTLRSGDMIQENQNELPIASFSSQRRHPWTYLVFGLIGFAFGFTLEMSGFGDSRKLAAQFYFTEMTVLKVMFTAIVTAMVLLFGAVGLGILDFSQVWVNPTYISLRASSAD